MSGRGTLLETRSVRSPLGVRLLDPRDDRPVRDLHVTAHAPDGGADATRAHVTIGGVHAFERVPGVPPMLDGVGGDPPAVDVAVSVRDPRRRFVPATHVVEAPNPTVPARPDDGLGLYVFPAPGVAGDAPGFGAVRADLVDADDPDGRRPAAHAVLTAHAGDAVGVGIAGADGRVVAFVPLPSPPPGAGPQPSWPLTVTVRWEPGRHRHVADLPVPTVDSLFAQDEADVIDLVDPQLRAGEPPALTSAGGRHLRIRRA